MRERCTTILTHVRQHRNAHWFRHHCGEDVDFLRCQRLRRTARHVFFCSSKSSEPPTCFQKACRWLDSIFITNPTDLDPINIWTCSIIAMASVSMMCHGPIRWAATRAPSRAWPICRPRRMGLPPGFTSGLCRPKRPQTMSRPGCFRRTVI